MTTYIFIGKEELEELRAIWREVSQGKEKISLSPEGARILERYLSPLSQKDAVVVAVPLEARLTLEGAAQILGVSRPHLHKLMEEGKIPYHQEGSWKYIQAQDLLEYKERALEEGLKTLRELAEEAQELGLLP